MSYKSSFESNRNSIKRRQRSGALVLSVVAVLLVGVGLTLVFLWLRDAPVVANLFSTNTPTPTETPTPLPATETPTATLTPTETSVPTDAPTATAAAPFAYIVETGDSLLGIADKFDVDYFIIMVLNGLTADDFLFVGQQLIIPDPNTGLPSPTPVPPNVRAGDLVQYMVVPGDTLRIIAEKLFSTEDAILAENDLDDPNTIFPGQILLVPYRLITPTPTLPATITPVVTPTPTSGP